MLRTIAELQIAAGPDGPYPYTAEGVYCDRCQQRFTTDIFVFRHLILCGDCRYYERTGNWPTYEPAPGRELVLDAADLRFGGGHGSETLNRFQNYRVRSEQHAACLDQALSACSAAD